MAKKKRAGTRGPGTSKRNKKGLLWVVYSTDASLHGLIYSRHRSEAEANTEAQYQLYHGVRQETEEERDRRLAKSSVAS